jgi:pSer/pThr/pTyr-binding forkhead associated (FHA) protein
MKFRLTTLSQPFRGARFDFDQTSVTLGRNPEADLVIDKEQISGFHAQIIARQGRLFLEDLESVNGTFLNDQCINEPVMLHPGDTIRLGAETRFRFLPGMDDVQESPGTDQAGQKNQRRLEAKPGKKLPVWVLIVVGGLFLLCFGLFFLGGGGYYLLNVLNTSNKKTSQAVTEIAFITQQAQIQQTEIALTEGPIATSTAEAELAMTATPQAATSQAQATQTHQAGLTATALSETQMLIEPYIDGEISSELLIFGPKSGSITQEADGSVEAYSSDVSVLNGVVIVDFYPPHNASETNWDVGIFFRDLGSNDEYRLVLKSTGYYGLNDRLGDENNYLVEGTTTNLNLATDEVNQILLIFNEDKAYFFLNGSFVNEFDISRRMESGNISFVTDVNVDNVIDGAKVYFENFRIYELVP